ncbi:MAG: aspartate/glutamate racemase family protein [Candidatus Thorarchaeota archaeon]|nr:MAG: aspartate/glutamate racemase family protein [Candidatus Thorarchaeota archaeon]
MKLIALIGATGIDWWTDEKKNSFVKLHTPQGYRIDNFTPRYGTHSVESEVDEAYNAPFILEQVAKASRGGYDAIVIDCACDPILDAARQITTVPVIGPMNSSLHFALTLGTRFSIITVQGQSLKRCMEARVRKEALDTFCASVRFFTMPVLDISKRSEAAQKNLSELCKRVVVEDGADVIVLGCTGLSHEVDLKPIMNEVGVPILDPFVIAVRAARLLVESGLTHSKVAYPTPPRKKIAEAPSLEGAFDDVLKD